MISDSSHQLGWQGWGPRDPEPSTLIALWPDAEPPTRTEVLAAIAQAGYETASEDEAAPNADSTLWTAVLRGSDEAPPIIVWAEPAQPMSPGELDDPAAADCKWIVGYQTALDISDPLPSLVALLRRASAGVPDAPAMLDVNARRWLPRSQLALLVADDAPLPPNELLWTIEVVSREGEPSEEHGGVWLRTQGLLRCGRPELEMLEVPSAQTPVAATLLNDVAELLLEVALPEPGEAFEIGVGLRVALQPWSTVGAFLREGAAGTAEDRVARGVLESVEHNGPDGDVAIVCAAQPSGQFRKLWIWPGEVARALAEDGAAVYKTTRTTERTAALAQHTWPELAMTWARVHRNASHDVVDDVDEGVVVLIKVGFEVISEEAPAREHLWFMVQQIAGDKALGRLINQPMHATTMSEGDEVWVERAGVSDWRLITPAGVVQPADMLLRSSGLDRLVAELEAGR